MRMPQGRIVVFAQLMIAMAAMVYTQAPSIHADSAGGFTRCLISRRRAG
jgi:hypothetical protein